jgi:CHAD domain-containing protein
VARPTDVPGLSPATPLAVAGPLLVRARLADVRRLEPGFAADGEPDADAVHDMRVAVRRLRAALALAGDRTLRALDGAVRALQDALGEVRDAQVLRRWFGARAGDGDGADAAALVAWADRRAAKATRRLRPALDAWTGAVAPMLEREADGAGGRGRLGGARIAGRVRRRLRTLGRRVERARRRASPRRVHRLRIAVKKARYLAELVEPGWAGAAGATLAMLEPLQDRLGALHDADVRSARLERLARRGGLGARRAARAMLPRVRAERDRDAARLRAELDRWRAERAARALRRGFRRHGAAADGAARLAKEPVQPPAPG